MSNTIYLPPAGKGIGAALGEGMSAGIIKGLQKQEMAEKAKRFGSVMQQIGGSPDRATAMERAAALITEGAEDIADVNAVYAHIDRAFPISAESPVEVQAVGPDNRPVSKYVKQGKVSNLNTPEGMRETFGEGYRLGGKPEEELEFLRPPTPDSHLSSSPEAGNPPVSLGKFPVNKRPEGAISTQEYTMGRQMAADKASIVSQDLARAAGERSDAAAVRAEAYLKQSQEREQRIAAAAGKEKAGVAERANVDDFRQDLSKLEGSISRGLGKQLTDGTWTFEGENERKLFYQRAEWAADQLEKQYAGKGSRNYLAIAKKAVEQFPGKADLSEEPAPAPKPKPKEKGYVEKVKEGAVNLFKGKPTVKSQADYDKLAPGTEFVDEKGKPWKKPKKDKK